MNCRRARSKFESLLSRDLSSYEQERLKRHLRDCSSCRNEILHLARFLSSLRNSFYQCLTYLPTSSPRSIVVKPDSLSRRASRPDVRIAPLVIFVVLIIFLSLAIPSNIRLMPDVPRFAATPSLYPGGGALASWSSLSALHGYQGTEVGWRISFY